MDHVFSSLTVNSSGELCKTIYTGEIHIIKGLKGLSLFEGRLTVLFIFI